MKVMFTRLAGVVVGILSLVSVSQAGLQLGNLSLSNPIIIDGESLPSFANRVRAEITCENLFEKLNDYQKARVDIDQAMRDSFNNISNILYQWDAELYRIIGRPGVSYSGALGRYARAVGDYNYQSAEVQNKLQTYVTIFGERLTLCNSSR